LETNNNEFDDSLEVIMKCEKVTCLKEVFNFCAKFCESYFVDLFHTLSIKNIINPTDNSFRLQHFIDWNSALIPQISKLGETYNEWVNKPVDRSMKLFSNPVLESLSKVCERDASSLFSISLFF
jgi:hypothetical protein